MDEKGKGSTSASQLKQTNNYWTFKPKFKFLCFSSEPLRCSEDAKHTHSSQPCLEIINNYKKVSGNVMARETWPPCAMWPDFKLNKYCCLTFLILGVNDEYIAVRVPQWTPCEITLWSPDMFGLLRTAPSAANILKEIRTWSQTQLTSRPVTSNWKCCRLIRKTPMWHIKKVSANVLWLLCLKTANTS